MNCNNSVINCLNFFSVFLEFRNPHNSDGRQKSKIIAEMDARKCALKLCREIFRFSNTHLATYSNYLNHLLAGTASDGSEHFFHPLNPNFITTLLPSVISHLQKLAASDPRVRTTVIKKKSLSLINY